MDLQVLSLGPIGTNCYIVADKGHCMVVDPGAPAQVLESALKGRSLDCILLTHCHWDHSMGVSYLLGLFPNAPVACHVLDATAACDPQLNGAAKWGYSCAAPRVDKELQDGGLISIGDLEFKILHTPGHSLGSCCFYEEKQKILIAGDTLFAGGGWGRTDLPGGSEAQIRRSMGQILAPIPDDVLVLSGHGPSSTMGKERRLNSYLGRL